MSQGDVRMKFTSAVVAVLLCVNGAPAQDRVPQEEARALAKVITAVGKKARPPLEVDPDTDKPYAKKKDDYGAMFIPDRRLSAERLAGAGKELVPVGHL